MAKPLLYTAIGLIVLIILGGIAFAVKGSKPRSNAPATSSQSGESSNKKSSAYDTNVSWQYMADGWEAVGSAPDCPKPFEFKSPVDLTKVTAILYPGQTRGGNYKPHGGFLFNGAANNEVTVTVPYDAQVVEGSRYIEAGETQYLFDFQVPCGVRYRFDHLHTLSPAFQTIADKLPPAQKDDSRTTPINPPVDVSVGDTVATVVGFPKMNNASLDWGVYDLRNKNEASSSAAPQGTEQLSSYAVCWFDWLNAADEAKVRSLPAGDQASGKQSDYCK